MFVYFSADNLCPKERSSRLTVSYEEQIMSKDKFTRIFFRYKWRVLYLVSVLKLTHPLLLTRFFKIYFVVICSLKKKMYPFLCYQIYLRGTQRNNLIKDKS